MNKYDTLLLALVMAATLTSCELIGDIFGAGVYTGIFLVVAVIVLILIVVFRAGKKG